MMRWFSLTVIGFFALYGAWHFYVTPLAPHAPERTGWLFRQFGQQGIAVGMLLIAIAFILIGLVGMRSLAARLRALRDTRIRAASPEGASHRPLAQSKGGSHGAVRSALIGLIFLITGGGIGYFGLYLPFLTGRPHNIKASFAMLMMIGYGLALLLLGQDFAPTMYRRKDGVYIPTIFGAATLVALLGLGLGLNWWLATQLRAHHY
jgi:hypothetical protein